MPFGQDFPQQAKGFVLEKLFDVAYQFSPFGSVRSVLEHGGGNVNDTYIVEGEGRSRFIMQRINTRVFKRPERIIQNMVAIDKHIESKRDVLAALGSRRWALPTVLHARNGKPYFVDSDKGFWRAISFIEGATAHGKIESPKHAREAGFALGFFQFLISDMNVSQLHDTLPGFHVTPEYVWRYNEVLQKPVRPESSVEVRYCKKIIADRAEWASVLENARDRGELVLRPIHGDPKTANIMVDNATGEAIALIDLDTVKPGLVHYDVGDCVRSCCNPLGEETTKFDDVVFDVALAREILSGYLSVARDFFTNNDYEYMFDAMRLIAFELGVRFFTDYLEGDVYFKVKHPHHNLHRAMVQFKLAESIENQESAIRAIIHDARRVK
jgi:Ser/Thr protein kinase RdoA (MazF antagonist)